MTKRQLGFLITAVGLLGVIGLLAMDLIGAGQHQGIGPAQRLALLAGGGVILIGLSLLPLGERPA